MNMSDDQLLKKHEAYLEAWLRADGRSSERKREARLAAKDAEIANLRAELAASKKCSLCGGPTDREAWPRPHRCDGRLSGQC